MTSRRRASEDTRVDERRMALDARVDRRPALRKSAPLISRQTVSRRRDSILENRQVQARIVP